MKQKKKVLLFGPDTGDFEGSYGGGTGGYTRNMFQYLNHFRSDDFQMTPCYHTVAGQGKARSFVSRFFTDFFTFLKAAVKVRPAVVHILAQYRTATPREFSVVFLSRLLRIPVVYEIKAGSFTSWFGNTNFVFHNMVKFCIRHADTVLCEGQPNVDLLEREMQIKGIYYPNFVSVLEIPGETGEKLQGNALRVLFVGYAFREKGVFELVEGCNAAAAETPVELSLIGKEHPEFSAWLDELPRHKGFTIQRLGRLPHEIVMDYFGKNDIYCYPTRHPGEGHNNSINEAMMHGMVIVTARQGFLETVLQDTAYFVPEVSAAAIADALLHIARHKEAAKQKSRETRQRLLDNFTDTIAFRKLHTAYYKAAGQ